MRFCLLFIGAIVHTTTAQLPTLVDVARGVAVTIWRSDFNQLWKNLQGEALIASAVDTRHVETIKAAVFLGGEVVARSAELEGITKGFASLCEYILTMRNELFSETAFDAKKHQLMEKKKMSLSESQMALEAAVLFPWGKLNYVCGNELPLQVKLAILKERSARVLVTPFNNFEEFKIVPTPESLEISLDRLRNLGTAIGRGELGLLFDVEDRNREGNSNIQSSRWISRMFDLLFTSDYFARSGYGEYSLVLGKGYADRQVYLSIGELLGLAVLHGVRVPVKLDYKLILALVSESLFNGGESPWIEIQLVRSGFYAVTSLTAVWGSFSNPKRLLNEREMENLLARVL